MNPIVLSIPIFFILIGIEIIYDRITNKNLYRINDAISNISCGIFEQITGVFAKVLTVAMFAVVYEQFRFFTIPNTWYWLLILFLGVDLAYYWAHRMSHEINLLWVGHVVHHQSEEYNLSVALRQGAFQKVFTSFFYLPLALLGFSPEFFLILTAYNTLYQFWIHTEAIKKLWVFEWVMNTPSHHRVHHGRNPKYIDRNHAGVFIIWDKMFGTFQKEKERPVYGITTPIECWDPVTSHVKPFTNLWSDLKIVKEWKYKFQLLWMPPGWLPKKYGGYREPKDVVPETYEKFETKLNAQLNWYLFIHFLFIIGGASIFLFGLSNFSFNEKILFAVMITSSVMSTGFLFELKSWSKWFEASRLVTIGFFLLLLILNSTFVILFSISLLLIVLASLYWLFRFSSTQNKS